MALAQLAVYMLVGVTQAAQARPNMLLFLADQWRWDWAGFDEPAVSTPNIQKLKKRGVRFTHAYVPSPLCVPSRGAFAAGCEYDDSPMPDNEIDFPVDGSLKTIYQALREAGYHTMLAGKDHLSEHTGVGLDGSVHADALGFDDALRTMDKYDNWVDPLRPTEPYGVWLRNQSLPSAPDLYKVERACYGYLGEGSCCEDIWKSPLQGFLCPGTEPSNDFQIDDWVRVQAATLLKRKPLGKPWFLQVGFPSPHPPFILTPRMKASIQGRSFPLAHDNTNLSEATQLRVRQEYAALIENVDTNIGKILDHLREAGELDNTVIVVTADHGEQLGDHDRFDKMVPWDGSTRVPLVFSGPGVHVGRVFDIPVATLDVAGTLLDIAGTTGPPQMTTRSLWPMLTGDKTEIVRNVIASGFSRVRPPKVHIDWRMVLRRFNSTAVLKLVCCPNGCPRTFGEVQGSPELFMFNVHGNAGEAQGFRSDILPDAMQEAQELVQFLPPKFQVACKPLITQRSRRDWAQPITLYA